jgi:hypothetical protein
MWPDDGGTQPSAPTAQVPATCEQQVAQPDVTPPVVEEAIAFDGVVAAHPPRKPDQPTTPEMARSPCRRHR